MNCDGYCLMIVQSKNELATISMSQPVTSPKALVMGFFSTVGDLACLQNVERWLEQTEIPYDVAPYSKVVQSALPGSVNPRKVRARDYSHLIVVCGPCWAGFFAREKIKLRRFEHCVRIGINLTMVEPLTIWNPFDVLIERDSERGCRPDLAFLGSSPLVPVVGRCLIDRQNEYGRRQRHDVAIRAINDLIVRRDFAVVDVDTRWHHPAGAETIRTPASVLAILTRVDLLLTNRLHGLVYAVKAGVPVIVIDPIAGGGKVSAQARAIGWPKCILADEINPDWLEEAVNWCGSSKAQAAIRTSQEQIATPLSKLEEEFRDALQTTKRFPVPALTQRGPFLRSFARWLKRQT
jgi:Polysaccharide pyruvyl transferase